MSVFCMKNNSVICTKSLTLQPNSFLSEYVCVYVYVYPKYLEDFVCKCHHAVRKQPNNKLVFQFLTLQHLSPISHPTVYTLVFQFYREKVRIKDIKQLAKGQTSVRRSSSHWNPSISKILDELSTQT